MNIESIKNNSELFRFLSNFYGGDFEAFLDCVIKKPKSAIRVNTLKANKDTILERLLKQGFKLKKVAFYEYAFVVEESPVELGNTVEHFVGYYYVQSLSSLIPPLVLAPQPGEVVLDIASAPGSKTTQMAQMMENRGVIVANDVDIKRVKALANNIDRMGVLNTIITIEQGHKFGKLYPETFDKILVDAPCSALGTLGKNPEVVKWWSREKIGRLMATQKSLILSGFDALKPGGIMVYSTCTVTPEENEYIVNYLLQEREGVEILDFHLPGVKLTSGLTEWERLIFKKELVKCKRIEPHLNPGFEGFFIALMRKSPS